MTVFRLGPKLTFDEGNLGLRHEVAAAVATGTRAFVVNVGAVIAIDSYGLAELASSHTAVTRAGGRLVFCELSHKVREVLTVTRLGAIFETRASEGDAMAVFGNA